MRGGWPTALRTEAAAVRWTSQDWKLGHPRLTGGTTVLKLRVPVTVRQGRGFPGIPQRFMCWRVGPQCGHVRGGAQWK